jgi:hypothetical protein
MNLAQADNSLHKLPRETTVKVNENSTDQRSMVDHDKVEVEEDDEVIPDLAHVSDNSESTTDSFLYQEDHGIRRSSSSPMIITASSSHASVPSAMEPLHRRGPSLRSSSDISSSIARPSCRPRPCVSFGTVEMKEFAMILGDHPDTEQGPAVSQRMLIMLITHSSSFAQLLDFSPNPFYYTTAYH